MKIEEALQRLQDWEKENPRRKLELEAAMARNGQLFCPCHIDQLTEEKFKTFLTFGGNQHWHGLQRHSEIYEDFPKLRESLTMLVDERRKIEDRLDELTKKDSPSHIKGLKEAVLTPILMCAYPCRYAVYNSISLAALAELGLGLQAKGGAGRRFVELNGKCLQLAKDLDKPLWLIDVMFSRVVHDQGSFGSADTLNS